MHAPVMPYIEVPGDAPEGTEYRRIMARAGTFVGMSETEAVWQYGFLPQSDMASAFGVAITESETGYGLLWVRATRRTGKVRETWRGYALDLPESFRKVLRWTGQVHSSAWERMS